MVERVSYTHLDVYKRQVFALDWENYLPLGARFPISKAKCVKSKLHNEPSVQAISKKAVVKKLQKHYARPEEMCIRDRPAPVLEVPEFTGGVNAVEALVHELPAYTGPLSTVGDQAAPTVEKPEFQGGVNAVEALVHELPAYTGPLSTVGDQALSLIHI